MRNQQGTPDSDESKSKAWTEKQGELNKKRQIPNCIVDAPKYHKSLGWKKWISEQQSTPQVGKEKGTFHE